MKLHFHVERLTKQSRTLICSVDESDLGETLLRLKSALGDDVEFYADVPRDGHRMRELIQVPKQ